MRDLVPLVGLVPEARLNLVIHYLRKGDVQPAFDLMKDVEPTQPQVRSRPSPRVHPLQLPLTGAAAPETARRVVLTCAALAQTGAADGQLAVRELRD